MQTSK